MKPEFCENYAELDREHWWWKARRMFLKRELAKITAGTTNTSILDVGCGDGLFFDDLSAHGDVHGIERDPRMLTANGRHRERIHVGPFDGSFQPNRRFDLILMLDVLEHVDERGAALRRASELLSAGGQLILSVPAFQALWTQHDVLCEHRLRYNRKSLRTAVQQSGFEVQRARYFFHWMYPAKLAVRLMEAIVPSHPRSPRLLPRPLNRLIYGVCRLEEALFGGLGLPFGSSLFMVCRPSPTD